MFNKKMEIAILGGGSWGTALAVHLAKNNIKNKIRVWEFFEEQANKMQLERKCPFLPKITLQSNIFISHLLKQVLENCELILIVVPSDKVEVTLNNAKKYIKDQPLIICSKGFANETKLLTEAIGEKFSNELYCLYGPTHAEEVCQGIFSGIVLAGGKNKKNEEKIKKIIASENMRVDLSDDIIGVQVASALKNITALFVGVLDGLKLGDNAKAYIMTKSLAEIKEIGLKLGAKVKTFYGLAGMGDLIVTSTSKHSRNRHVGEEIGKGRKLKEILDEMKMVAEGVTTLKTAVQLKEKLKLDLPLITGLYEIIFKGKNAKEILKKI